MSKPVRIYIALVLQIIAVLFALMSWIDPLEGGVAMTMSIGWSAIAFFVGRIPVPKFAWITAAACVVFLVVFWSIYLAEIPADTAQMGTYKPSSTILSLLWVYRVLAIAFISGSIFYAVFQFTERRKFLAAGDN